MVVSCKLLLGFLSSDIFTDFVATETGSNKKQSTAICALSMVRQLFKANLIERQGETIKHVTRGGLLGSKKPSENKDPKPNVEDVTMSANAPVAAPGQKRKADEQVSLFWFLKFLRAPSVYTVVSDISRTVGIVQKSEKTNLMICLLIEACCVYACKLFFVHESVVRLGRRDLCSAFHIVCLSGKGEEIPLRAYA